MPDEHGFWFFTPEIKDWDLSKLIGVERWEYSKNEIEFWTTPYSQRKLITPDMGWWFGPFRVLMPPKELME